MSKERLIERWKNLKQPIINELTCYVCNYKNNIDIFNVLKTNDIFEAGELIRYECPECNLIFGDLRFLNLSNEEIENDYIDAYSYYSEGNTKNYILDALNSLDLFKDKNKSYLDYACGKKNTTIEMLFDKGYNIYGYDKYVECNSKFFINNITNMKFDVIYCNNYIEHLIKPYEDLLKMVEHINKGGYLILISSCFEYVIEYTHYHTFFFSDKSLNILAEKLDLEFIDSKKIYFSDGEFTIIKVFKKY